MSNSLHLEFFYIPINSKSAFLHQEIISEILLKGDKSHYGKFIYKNNVFKENELINDLLFTQALKCHANKDSLHTAGNI